MTEDKIKEHAISFINDISKDCTEKSELDIERHLFDYTRLYSLNKKRIGTFKR